MKEIIKDGQTIENMIYEIRGKQVMLDSDLATLYGVETKRIMKLLRETLRGFQKIFIFN